jgi:hypothetical protein
MNKDISRLKKLAGLIKEDFELPDESPFEEKGQEAAAKQEIIEYLGDIQNDIDKCSRTKVNGVPIFNGLDEILVDIYEDEVTNEGYLENMGEDYEDGESALSLWYLDTIWSVLSDEFAPLFLQNLIDAGLEYQEDSPVLKLDGKEYGSPESSRTLMFNRPPGALWQIYKAYNGPYIVDTEPRERMMESFDEAERELPYWRKKAEERSKEAAKIKPQMHPTAIQNRDNFFKRS